ncbi:hypothetical protein [Phytomonospora endophytica]|uniref:Secreted protein n=1 Tax=Phytomonospora endophytica TaxID=714109 RepID=A0A841FHR6_9ACTN|nr:hypothetical protein [Phytomonospora endophytica]MBB6032209.1 hypothetical protein [Phytomonospora endophytica]GIG68558.1 hypothetical protein Pen01_48530 [Phytomonospora endophytica]
MRQTAKRWRTAVVIGVFAATALAGCGSGDGAGEAGASPSADPKSDMLAYTRCMRDNGVPMEDPQLNADGEGSLSLPEGVDRATLDAAEETCRKLMPNGGEPPELDAEVLERLRAYAKCMREHGVDDFPDPEPKGGIQYEAPPPGTDADFTAAEDACEDLMPAGGSNETHEEGA